MKICAIISEYNPLHNGHKYQIEQAKLVSGADAILVLMSGDFVQRAEGAIFNKYLRAKAALENGADFVFELPTIIATSCGQLFAEGAINILNKFSDIEYLCFGCENSNLEYLKNIAETQLNEGDEFKKVLKQNLQNGLSYASSYAIATSKTANLSQTSHTMSHITRNTPNNLLGIEYIKALIKSNSKIKPLPIQRLGSDYNSEKASGEFISASGARKLFEENDYENLKKYIPLNIIDEFIFEYKKHTFNKKLFESLIINSLRNEQLINLLDANNDLENKLKENAFRFLSLDDIILQTKSKCYSYSRIKRLALQALLKITREDGESIMSASTRLLAINKNFKTYISEFPIIVTIQNNDIKQLIGKQKSIADIDERASNIYSLLTNKTGNQFFCNGIIIN